MSFTWKGILTKAVVWGVVGYLGFGLAALLFQKKLIYHPRPSRPSEEVLLDSYPWLQEVRFSSSDGNRLHGVWMPPPSEHAAVLIFSHGNAGNLFHRLALLDKFREAGLGVFLYDYRGYGLSEGSPGESGLYRDSEAAWDWVTQKEISPSRLISYGRSLGAAVALQLALSREVGAVVLDVPFTSIEDMAGHILPFFPSGPFLIESYDNLGKVGSLDHPLLVVIAENDQVVPPWMGKVLFEAAPQPKRLLIVSDAGHSDTSWVGDEYVRYIKELAASMNP